MSAVPSRTWRIVDTSCSGVPTLPVGGTWISEHSLFGDWGVDVYLDRDRAPILSRGFTLVP
jgi:hypothetical protein